MFDSLQLKNEKSAKTEKWEFEVKEDWLPYGILTFYIVGAKREFVYLGKMAK
jgi:hypothetical protein